MTSYRFHDHGARPGRRDALVDDDAGRIATLTYGDSATVRVTNVGRVRAKEDEPPGFWLDLADGRWMNEKDAAEASGDSSEMPVVDADGNETTPQEAGDPLRRGPPQHPRRAAGASRSPSRSRCR